MSSNLIQSDNARGAVLMMLSMAAFTLNDLCIKAIGPSIPLSQLLVLRGLLACALIYALARSLDAVRMPVQSTDRWMVLVRASAETGAAYFFLTALMHMPFANVTAVLQILPLTVTLAAALLLREPVGWRRLSAITVGFFGVLLIVKPGTDGFTIHTVYVLVAVIFVTIRDLAVRRLSGEVPSLTVTLISAVFVTGFAGIASLSTQWVPLDFNEILLIVLSGVFIIGGYVFSVMVMRVGEVSFVAPFRYTALIWAVLLGYVFFGEWPDDLTFFGAAIIAGAGIFTLLRERRVRKKHPARQ